MALNHKDYSKIDFTKLTDDMDDIEELEENNFEYHCIGK